MPLELHVYGGNSAIGRGNCYGLIDTRLGRTIIQDCGGMQLEGSDEKRVSQISPFDFSNLNGSKTVVVLSHAHEDHFAGLHYLAKHFGEMADRKDRIALYGAAFTQGCVRQKYLSRDRQMTAEMKWGINLDKVFERLSFPSSPLVKKPFEVEVVPVDHSVPQSVGILTTWTPGGRRPYKVVNLADFRRGPNWEKLSCNPKYQRPDVLMLDASGALTPGFTMSPELGIKRVAELVAQHPKSHIWLSGFASNLDQYAGIEAAVKGQRTMDLAGLSMVWKRKLGSDLNLIAPHVRLTPPKGGKLLTLATGAQAESGSAMQKFIFGESEVETFDPSAVIIMCARVIPGNEAKVQAMLDRARSQMNSSGRIFLNHNSRSVMGGAYDYEPLVASGHCSQDDYVAVVKALMPRSVIPIHGSLVHRQALKELIESLNLGIECLLVEDGESIELAA